ncbi:unnamed protein product, partial [Didymodactylos carnosus]
VDDDGTDMDLQLLIRNYDLCPLLYKIVYPQRSYFYLTFGDEVLIDFDEEKDDISLILSILISVFYVFDITYPTVYKPLLEVLEFFIFDRNNHPSSAKLTVPAQNFIIEYNRKTRS